MRRVLNQKFFHRETQIVAQDLLGKFLLRRINGKEIAGMIIETEAYDGSKDRASHAFKGRTKRTEVMFGHPGFWYVYLCYGMYYLLNIVTREKDYPAGVLIRGIQLEDGTVLNGPGKLTKFLHIDKTLNNKKAGRADGLWIEDRGTQIAGSDIQKTARVGVSYAGPIWAAKKLRFLLKKGISS